MYTRSNISLFLSYSLVLLPDFNYNNEDEDLLKETLSEASKYQQQQQRPQETPFPQLNEINDYITDLSKRADTPPAQVEDTSGVTAVSTKPSKGNTIAPLFNQTFSKGVTPINSNNMRYVFNA